MQKVDWYMLSCVGRSTLLVFLNEFLTLHLSEKMLERRGWRLLPYAVALAKAFFYNGLFLNTYGMTGQDAASFIINLCFTILLIISLITTFSDDWIKVIYIFLITDIIAGLIGSIDLLAMGMVAKTGISYVNTPLEITDLFQPILIAGWCILLPYMLKRPLQMIKRWIPRKRFLHMVIIGACYGSIYFGNAFYLQDKSRFYFIIVIIGLFLLYLYAVIMWRHLHEQHRYLASQIDVILEQYDWLNEKGRQIEENRKQMNLQMEEFAQKLAKRQKEEKGEAISEQNREITKYIQELTAQYEELKGGALHSDWEIDALLGY